LLDKTIKIFLTVADAGSMNKAAAKLYLSPTAVMNEMNKLEAHLGFSLFVRTNRGLTLTDAGKSLYDDAKYLSVYSQKAIANARLAANPSQINIRIGSSYLRPCSPFMKIWNEIKSSNRQFKISVVPFNDNSLDDIFHSLGKDFDILGSICDITNWKKHFQFAKLWDSEFMISLSPNHPLALKDQLTIQDLYGERILFIQAGTSAIIDDIRLELIKNHSQVQIENYLPHYDLDIFNRCTQEETLVLSTNMWDCIHPSLKSLPLDWGGTIPYGIMYPLESPPHLTRFINLICSANSNLGGVP